MQTWIRANIGKLIERFGDMSLKLITAAEFEALEEKDPNTLYIVTDSEADTVELYLGDKKISDDIISKTITENGTYNASADGADGYNPVTVDIPIVSKTITENGTYNASEDEAAGYSTVTVNVPASSTIVSKTITTNGTYNASADSADGYDPVTVNVPQPVITTTTAAADLTGYEAGDTDLGNGFTITNDSGIVGVGSETIEGVTYSGLEIGGAATFKTMQQLSNAYQNVEFQVIPTAWASGDMRIVSTGGIDYPASVWTSLANPYLMYVLTGVQLINDDSLVSLGANNYYDPNLPHSSLIDELLTIKYTYTNDRVVLSVNGVPKATWTASTFNSVIASYGLNVGANGAAGADMLVVNAEISSDSLSWNSRTWVPM